MEGTQSESKTSGKCPACGWPYDDWHYISTDRSLLGKSTPEGNKAYCIPGAPRREPPQSDQGVNNPP